MTKSNAPAVSASQVREYFNADPKRLAALSPEARFTVEVREGGKFPRGRLHRDAVAVHNKRRKAQYVQGTPKPVKAAAKPAKGKGRKPKAAQPVSKG